METFSALRYVHTCAGGRGRKRAENWLQHKSLHVFKHARSRSGGGAGAKSAPQEMGPTPNLPRPLRNRALQTIFVLKKWQIRSASAPRMCEHTRGSGAGMSKSARLRSATAPRMCERSLTDPLWGEPSVTGGFSFGQHLYECSTTISRCVPVESKQKIVYLTDIYLC